MPHIEIISSSVRTGRNSHRVALYFKSFLEEYKLATAGILDLNEFNFPLFEERLHLQKNPSSAALDFASRIKSAGGVLIITPEYNGGYPASLKNVIDLLRNEWQRKPVAISSSSEGSMGGSQVIVSLQFILWKMHAWTVPATFPVPGITEAFDVSGVPADKSMMDKRAKNFIDELLWCIEANRRMSV
jgi:NAD(P)H-dependent FMN reductase